jgi:predicted RecB family nuclease
VRLLDGEWLYSASDLTGFAACEHLTQLERRVALDEIPRPDPTDPLLDVLARRGDEHERAVFDGYGVERADIVEIRADTSSRAGLERAAAETIAAMSAGAPLIYQATFLHDAWMGHADFLERVPRPSELGEWSYEVADAKLARSVKAAALVQLCSYSEHVERIQGRAPERLHVVTGDHERHSYRLVDVGAYFRALKRRFLEAVASVSVATYPDPVEHCSICRWNDVCTDKRRADDHLSIVAGMRRDQTRKFVDAGVTTMNALATTGIDAADFGIGPLTFERLQGQAELQVESDGCVPPLSRILEPDDPDGGRPRGFAALPAPTPGDLFLDLEGDPYALDGGLEYLFGIVEIVDGTPIYHPFWAHDRAEEKRAFEHLIDFIADRRRCNPDLHIYHYAAYEPTAIGRLMGAHGTREAEVDDLLRGKVFVDLFWVIRHAVRLSTETYSLKDVEQLYLKRPPAAVLDAGSSIVWYERYLVEEDEQLLHDLAEYNQADCESLIGLREWLEEKRLKAEAKFGLIERRPPEPSPEPDELKEWEREITELAGRLTADVPDNAEQGSVEQRARWLLAQLLCWHRREDKPAWWKFFERVERATTDDLKDDTECIGELVYDREVGPMDRSIVHRYCFDPQDHKFGVGSTPVDPATGASAGTIIDLGDDYLTLKRGPTVSNAAHPRALIPARPYGNEVLGAAIRRVAEWVATRGIDADGPYRAARDLLLRRPPRIRGLEPGSDIAHDNESALDAASRIVTELEHACLPIQGPPGSGKTYTGAHMICTLLDRGARVGVTAHTHNSITNFLNELCKVGDERGVEVRAVQKTDEGKGCTDSRVECVDKYPKLDAVLAGGAVKVVAGTAWLWSRDEMRDTVDVLFVDEAGQMSLANVVAASGAAENIVLLGDPQQLAQPSHASHPPGAGASALQHVLRDMETIRPNCGLFLSETYRMHPAVCGFLSEIAYEGRLRSAHHRELQEVDGFAGLRFFPVEHIGNRVRSPEEAEEVCRILDRLLGRPWTDHKGAKHELTADDVVVIAPYNAQVAELHKALPDARIGTVDKFQGQEAVVAIYSMASSSVDDAPRGMSFLYDLHRLNVAVSRARAIGIVVCSPELLRVLCGRPEQVRLANALCWYAEVAMR